MGAVLPRVAILPHATLTLCDRMWHVSSRSGVATLRTVIHLLLAYVHVLVVGALVVARKQCPRLLCSEQCPAGQTHRVDDRLCETCDCFDPCQVQVILNTGPIHNNPCDLS